ncbi:GtrA family protein [Photobacterium leiognathi]|uniref:GtrA family protein n=1 Tax=Photobacterium leiognathi TaxID=553611 RepID=UPI002981E813|nr:GtrA family protein [Photobacterium leiognathi]
MNESFLKHFWQLNRFAIIGLLATAVHLSVVRLYFFQIQDPSEYTANVVGFSIAFLVSYFGHRHFTFGQKGSFLKFLAVSLMGFFINNITLASLLKSAMFSGWLAVTISTLCVPIITFILAKFWVFK